MTRALALLLSVVLAASSAWADPPCGVVEVRFAPGAQDLQIVVWIEDAQGHVRDTPYITRVTGTFGLANRPGAALLKTAFGWPYGRREMVFPVWAHRRDHHYPKVVMGGVCGNSPATSCVSPSPYAGTLCSNECEDSTIAYHERVSSSEPFYCSPSSPPDAVSCASSFTGSKGAYTTDGSYSLYPPRADLTAFNPSVDFPNLADFKQQNDLVAVSAATPPPNQLTTPPATWYPVGIPAGDYVAWIEVSQESDFNASHNHPNQADSVSAWNFEGHAFLGQPSIVYQVPFHYDGNGTSVFTADYAGYGDWDGTTGTLHPPDSTITTTQGGSGAGRLLVHDDGTDQYRAKVVVGGCPGGMLPDGGIVGMPDAGTGVAPGCNVPDPVGNLALSSDQTSLTVSFQAATTGAAANRFAVRYRPGSVAITDAEFDTLTAAPSAVGNPGDNITVTIDRLSRDTAYTVAVRAIAPCGSGSSVVSIAGRTDKAKFTTLHGCFIATAAWGSPLEAHVSDLRRFRDRHLLTNPVGRLLTAVYYAFSPPMARAIATDEVLRALARKALSPLVSIVAR
jgi:hypothetical protein